MGVRALVLKREGRSYYRVYYHHERGNPSSLGVKLIEALRSPLLKSWDDVASFCDLERLERVVEKPEDAYPRLQVDVEYIYVVDTEPPRLTIYATTFLSRLPPFAFEVYSCHIAYLPDPAHAPAVMFALELMSRMLIKALERYHTLKNG